MNSLKTDTGRIGAALTALEEWFDSIHVPDGYGGPVVGLHGVSMACCGPGFDWRYEGLLDGWCTLFDKTGDSGYLDRIEIALKELAAAQLRNGSFRNSCFEDNPLEGGMPYEAALMAAVCRARFSLAAAGRNTAVADRMIDRFVEQRLVRELWNRTLQTFNNWLQSDCDNWSPDAVAHIIEILLFHAEESRNETFITRYALGAGRSILRLQQPDGALPVSHRQDRLCSPFHMARCLPGLKQLAERTGETQFSAAAAAAQAFIVRQHSFVGYPFLIHARRPATVAPHFTGALAGICTAMARAGFDPADPFEHDLEFILSRQLKTGGFATAEGFGHRKTAQAPDWRDVVPCAGWNDKVYALLALLSDGKPQRAETTAVVRHVAIRGKPGIFTENAKRMQIEDACGKIIYAWNKKTPWAETCLL